VASAFWAGVCLLMSPALSCECDRFLDRALAAPPAHQTVLALLRAFPEKFPPSEALGTDPRKGDGMKMEPRCPWGHNHRAWIWANCPDARFRDGKTAAQQAALARELTEWKSPSCLESLAAAAASGRAAQYAG
jgi:hypothetical protein